MSRIATKQLESQILRDLAGAAGITGNSMLYMGGSGWTSTPTTTFGRSLLSAADYAALGLARYSAANGVMDTAGNPLGLHVQGQTRAAVSKADTDTAETTIWSLPIPVLGPLDQLRIHTVWQWPVSATAKVVRGRLAGQNFLSMNNTTNGGYNDYRRVVNRNSRTSQLIFLALGALGAGAPASISVDTSVPTTLTLTAQWGTAGDGSQLITLLSADVEIVRPAP